MWSTHSVFNYGTSKSSHTIWEEKDNWAGTLWTIISCHWESPGKERQGCLQLAQWSWAVWLLYVKNQMSVTWMSDESIIYLGGVALHITEMGVGVLVPNQHIWFVSLGMSPGHLASWLILPIITCLPSPWVICISGTMQVPGKSVRLSVRNVFFFASQAYVPKCSSKRCPSEKLPDSPPSKMMWSWILRLGDIPNFLTSRSTSRYSKSMAIHHGIHDLKNILCTHI